MVSRCMKVFAHQFSKPSFKIVSYRKSGSESTYHGISKQESVNRNGTVWVQLQTAYWVCSQILPKQKRMVWESD